MSTMRFLSCLSVLWIASLISFANTDGSTTQQINSPAAPQTSLPLATPTLALQHVKRHDLGGDPHAMTLSQSDLTHTQNTGNAPATEFNAGEINPNGQTSPNPDYESDEDVLDYDYLEEEWEMEMEEARQNEIWRFDFGRKEPQEVKKPSDRPLFYFKDEPDPRAYYDSQRWYMGFHPTPCHKLLFVYRLLEVSVQETDCRKFCSKKFPYFGWLFPPDHCHFITKARWHVLTGQLNARRTSLRTLGVVTKKGGQDVPMCDCNVTVVFNRVHEKSPMYDWRSLAQFAYCEPRQMGKRYELNGWQLAYWAALEKNLSCVPDLDEPFPLPDIDIIESDVFVPERKGWDVKRSRWHD